MSASPPVPAPAASGAARWQSTLPADLAASVVVFLVALPLSMGIALASGAPIQAGLIAAVVGGLVVGATGGAPLLVSGPAAGLAVMVYGFITELGYGVATAAFVAAGLLQVTLGALKVARLTLAISPAVIHGMLAGIGVLIVLGQLHIVLGGSPQSSAWKNLAELPGQIRDLHGAATVLGLLTVAILVAWVVLPLGKLRKVPGPLAAVLVATVAAALLGADVKRVALNGSLLDALQLPTLPAAGALGAFVTAVLSLTLVASAESLISAVATDKLHTGPRANLDRELVAQGLANTLSGLAGGLPITGVIVRSAANINAGAKTRLSAFLHGVWMLGSVLFLGALIEQVPLTVLAGLLVFTGARLVNLDHVRELRARGELSVYLVTIAGVVGINLLAGIGLGIALAVVRLLWRLGRVRVAARPANDGTWHVEIGGALTFVGVPALSTALAAVPSGTKVEVDLNVDSIDHAGFEALESWVATHRKTGGDVVMDSLEHAWHAGRTGPAQAPTAPARFPGGAEALR